MSSRTRLDHSVTAFAGELLAFVQRASDSINSLKRTVEQRPAAGVQDFKECLDDLEQQVSDFTDEVQQLVGCTSDTTSFEELIGHCAAVYASNRDIALALEEHLSQYGYQKPPGALLEPENPYDGMVEDDSGLFAAPEGLISRTCSSTALGRLSVRTAGCGALAPIGGQQRHAHSMPTSPVSKSMLGPVKAAHMPSRLGMSQPGSPMANYRAPAAATAAAGLWDVAAGGAADGYGTVGPKEGTSGIGFGMQQGWGLGSDAGYMQNAGCVPLTSMKQPERVSLGSNTSSTPAGLLISPGVAALANKYATSSVGGSSVGAMSLPDQCSTGPLATRGKRTACRDLSLSYAAGDTNSPDLPIFGRTPALSSQQQQQQQEQGAGVEGPPQHQWGGLAASGYGPVEQLVPDAAAGAAVVGAEAGAAAAGGCGGDDDTTGELYSSLIHSNINGLMHRDDDAICGDTDCAVEPATPTAAASTSCPSSPVVPTTAGRLPAEWHSKKMQELADLQANVTLTLSQMKRTPSRSRLAAVADEQTDDEDDTDGEEDQQRTELGQGRSQQQGRRGQQVQQQLVFGSGSSHSSDGNNSTGADMQQQQQEKQHMVADWKASAAAETGSSCSNTAAAAATANAAFARLQALPDTSTAGQQHLWSVVQGQQQQQVQCQAMAAGATSSTAHRNAAAAAAAAVSAAAAAAAAATADLESMMATLSMKYAAADPADAAAEASAAAAAATPVGLEDASSPAASEPSPWANAAEPESLSLKYTSLATDSNAAATAAAKGANHDKSAVADVPALPPPVPSTSPRRQPARSAAAGAAGTAALMRSSSSAGAVGCSVASDASCISSCDTTTPGKPRLAAALATWHNAVRMDCPSPLSPSSPAPLSPSSPVAAAAAADGGGAAAAPAAGEVDAVESASLLTPATQQAIRDAVAAAGLDTAARPKSSIRRLQPTTELQRLEEMRGIYRNSSQQHHHQQHHQQHHHQQQQQQQQQGGLAENLESRLASVAETETAAGPGSNTAAAAAAGVTGDAAEQADQDKQHSVTDKEQQDEAASTAAVAAAASSQQHSLRSRRQSTHAGLKQPKLQVPSLDLRLVQQPEQLTPRAARLQRRQQMQEQQQQAGSTRKAAAASAGAVLRAVENMTSAAAAVGGSAEKKPKAAAAAAAPVIHVQPVSEEEFGKLPGWCKGLLSVELLNGALQELAELAAGRAGKRGSTACEGFTAGDLELLGHSSSKSKTIVSCLHKLNRATLQRSAAGNNIYKLVGTASS